MKPPNKDRAASRATSRSKGGGTKFCGEFAQYSTCANIAAGKPCNKLHLTQKAIDDINAKASQKGKAKGKGKGKGKGKKPEE